LAGEKEDRQKRKFAETKGWRKKEKQISCYFNEKRTEGRPKKS